MAQQRPTLPANFAKAVELIDEAHKQDPRPSTSEVEENENGLHVPVPYELHYAHKMTKTLSKLNPDASPVLQVACRAQHFRRWEIPRDTYPKTRPGYLTWRAKLKSQAASQVSALLSESAIEPPLTAEDVDRIAALIRKEGLSSGQDPDVQTLEDAACLVFLEDQFDDFEKKGSVDEEKMVNILRKTWGKMGDKGKEIALAMELSDRAREMVGKALAG